MKDYSALLVRLEQQLAVTDKTPLYQRFARIIKQAVRQGDLQQDDFLPSEREFSLHLNISRITVRKALSLLEQQGIIWRSRGYGTQIRSQLEYSLQEPQGLSQQAVLLGKHPDTEWISKSAIACPADIARQLQVPVNSQVFLFKRIRYVDKEAVSLDESYIPAELIDNPEDIGISLYDYLRAHGIVPAKTQSRVTTRMPDPALQQQITLSAAIPVLVIKQLALSADGQPVEYSISYCRGDMYAFISG